jgi:hypothetical protein
MSGGGGAAECGAGALRRDLKSEWVKTCRCQWSIINGSRDTDGSTVKNRRSYAFWKLDVSKRETYGR